ncbi:nucleoside-diphosphate-sugar epimerase [Kibdelosporangium banguiense]|uniref:Nucleoside-diphosphate-sugar epimerase n=1 Tax=Kibdelosporangium banguiense TaxID=1365924 RepID=A0ABS4TX53_9PSEU|nr:NmrA family NAD(P)-binding protein [Kibdelosporangium banguiense]MBP2328948.1 nucleoside-diphosphate-sugar epimerase [Kibdelosporangium banguiense]
MDSKVIALAGGSGALGTLIAERVLARPDTTLRLLVRPGSRGKVAELERRGAQIVEGELGKDAGELAAFVDGASTVVSAVQGGPDVIIDGQAALLRAARAAGVARFIPSSFSLDLFKVPEGQIPSSDWRRQFGELADEQRGEVEVVHVLNGTFLDRSLLFYWYRVIDPATQTAYIWGDGDQQVDFTTYLDTARYAVEVAVDDQPVGRVFPVVGDRLSFRDLYAVYEKATGTTLRVERLGSMADLDARIAELAAGGFENFMQYLPLMYVRSSFNGDGKLDQVHNDRYPSIVPTNAEQYFGTDNG